MNSVAVIVLWDESKWNSRSLGQSRYNAATVKVMRPLFIAT